MESGNSRKLNVLNVSSNSVEVHLAGKYSLEDPPLPEKLILDPFYDGIKQVRFVNDGITEWDSSLLITVIKIKNRCDALHINPDMSALPKGLLRLIDLAEKVPVRTDIDIRHAPAPWLERLGIASQSRWNAFLSVLTFIGEMTLSLIRFSLRQAQYRRTDLWLYIQQCGPQALGIVTLISVLVGSILAFVGAIQLKMFNAEIYVANLVGLGMVIEMGALMTGIILAGRTGAAFAAQLGTMQVNEEIDALKTMGVSPVDYLVLPRVIALAVMTPLLVIYADLLGILGGTIVGIFILGIPPQLFFHQTTSMLTLWFCAQGLIKGSTFGIVVALSGCLRGIQCGRSASAVGEAATSAVVTGIVGIVIADAIWTFIFMMGGGPS